MQRVKTRVQGVYAHVRRVCSAYINSVCSAYISVCIAYMRICGACAARMQGICIVYSAYVAPAPRGGVEGQRVRRGRCES
jgi:hypothetical protein